MALEIPDWTGEGVGKTTIATYGEPVGSGMDWVWVDHRLLLYVAPLPDCPYGRWVASVDFLPEERPKVAYPAELDNLGRVTGRKPIWFEYYDDEAGAKYGVCEEARATFARFYPVETMAVTDAPPLFN